MLASLVSRLRDEIARLEEKGLSAHRYWRLLREAEGLLVQGCWSGPKFEKIKELLKEVLGVVRD